jgi:hypothetical protein
MLPTAGTTEPVASVVTTSHVDGSPSVRVSEIDAGAVTLLRSVEAIKTEMPT